MQQLNQKNSRACSVTKHFAGFDGGYDGEAMGAGYWHMSCPADFKYGSDITLPEEGQEYSNNLAEYVALDSLLIDLLDNDLAEKDITIVGDSALIINQLQGNWKVDKSKKYFSGYSDVQELLQYFKSVTFKWIPREQNKKADELATQALKEYQEHHKKNLKQC